MKHIVAIIDRSGSMGIIKNDMNGGIKEWFEGIKNEDALLTSVLFDDKYEVTNNRRKLENVDVNSLMISPRGSTALNDAMMKGLASIGDDEDAFVFVVTDGYENASIEATTETVKNRVDELTARGVEFLYLSADVNAFDHTADYGISPQSTLIYSADSQGTKTVSHSLRSSTQTYLNSNPKVGTTNKTA